MTQTLKPHAGRKSTTLPSTPPGQSMLDKARTLLPQMINWRRELHMHPELGFRETGTAKRVADWLEQMGCRVRRGVGGTGVVAEIGAGSPVVAIRADMDALPIQEDNPAPYTSLNPGVMHACGHDAHMTTCLGVAALLLREVFPGTLRLLFQPAEEVGDEEGISGAPRMIAAGAMEGVDLVLSEHVDSKTPTGAIRIEAGPASGGVDSWFGTVIGRGGHGARPHETVDPFILTAHVILALNAIVSRRLHPFDPAVVSIGCVYGGQAENVIPDRVKINGTLRFTETRVQKKIHAEIRRAFNIARTLGGNYELVFEIGTLPMINHPLAAGLIADVGADLLGVKNILPLEKSLGAEDFGCFSELAPGAMFTLGTQIKGDPRSLHSAQFDINEQSLSIGAAILAEAALRFLRGDMKQEGA